MRDGGYRLSQGIAATFSTMWRLVLGPGVIGFVLLLTIVLSANALKSLEMAEGSLTALAINIIMRPIGFLTTIFAVAVLCEMYRRIRP